MRVLETLVNKSLRFDVQAQTHLQKLAGKSLVIELQSRTPYLSRKYPVIFTPSGIQLENFLRPTQQIPAQTPDAMLSGPLKAFIHFARTKNAAGAVRLGLSLRGDSEILEKIQDLFLDLNIDWEEALAQSTGDIFAHQVGKTLRTAKKRQSKIFSNTAKSLSDYLQEESGILPTPTEVQYFMDAVDTLRSDVDRLEARLAYLEHNAPGEGLCSD